MMRAIKIHFVLFTTLLFLIGCSGPYTIKDSGKKIEISEDDSFQIVLEGEANSNYSWKLISQNEFVHIQNPVGIKKEGNKKIYTFTFLAKDDGEDTIVLVYTNGTKTKKQFDLEVVVGTMGEIYSN